MTAPGRQAPHSDRAASDRAGSDPDRRLGPLRRFVETAPFGICLLDREMRYLAISPRFRRDLGLGDAELAGVSHYEMFPETPEFRRAIHRRCLDGATESSDADAITRPDGSFEWYRRSIQPWHLEDGTIGGIRSSPRA